MKNKITNCSVLELPKIRNRAGNITTVENDISFPFKINRVFYLYDIPGGESRGAHAHIECHQLLIAVSGSFNVELNDGIDTEKISLNQPYKALHIPPGIWASEVDFSSGAICLVLASHKYEEKDYIRNYKEYVKLKNEFFSS